MSLPRNLDPVEIRILGCLLEKERTTPDAYPLSVNSLLSACNQKSSRDPVMTLETNDVVAALDRLHEEVLVWPVSGARTEKWRHSVVRRLDLDSAGAAVFALLLLRGPQTSGELRSRTERMHAFPGTAEIEAILRTWAERDEPLVVLLGRRTGQKERRWMHLAGGEIDEADLAPIGAAPARPTEPGLRDRVAELEDRVAALEEFIRENFSS